MLANLPFHSAWTSQKLQLIKQHGRERTAYAASVLTSWRALEQQYRSEQADLDNALFDWSRQRALIGRRTLLIRVWKQEKAAGRALLLTRQAEELTALDHKSRRYITPQ
jgi:hypothetical protein